MMSHPEHEDPAMAGHDDETAERAANRMLWESGLSALCDSCDDAKACLADLLEADAGFELRPEMEAAIRNLDMVKSRVAERLGYLESVSGEPEDAPSATDPDASGNGGDRRLETHPDASGDHNDFPHPFPPAEAPAAGGRTRVPAGEGSGLYLGSPRDSLVPPPAAPQAERARARGVALEALSAPTMGPEEFRLLWAEGDR